MFLKKKQRKLDKTIVGNGKIFLGGESEAIINVKAEDDSQIFSKYNYDNKDNLNSDFCEYLWENAKLVPLKKDIRIKIHNSGSIEKQDVQKAIKTHYRRDYLEAKAEIRHMNILSFSLLVVGLFLIVLLALLDKVWDSFIRRLVLEIFAWVFVWEAVDCFFLERGKAMRKCRQIQKLYSAKIEVIKK